MLRTEGGTPQAASDAAEGLRWFDRRLSAAIVVALVLVALSFLNVPRGYLGTDTGGKTATLEAMVRRGDWSLDVGYWAEAQDPDGVYHPMFGTDRTDEGWVQVTSLPMVLAARTLYDAGGYRAALALPIAGTVAAALAAAALAGRLGRPRDGTRALWLVGLGSPLLVYGLDLWEHSIGVAAIGWAAVLLHDAARGDSSAPRSAAAGALLASAATMRTEALVYTMVLVGAASLALAARGRWRAAATTGAAAIVGFAPVWLVNSAAEAAFGGQSRTDRATGAASGGGAEVGQRIDEGLRTTFAISATDSWAPVVLGVLLVAAVASAVAFGQRVPRDRLRFVVVGLACFTVLTTAPGLGFVPGLFAAFPIAAAALAWNRVPGPARITAAAAITALPVVWAFQYIGGAGPQWAGRYVLPTTLLLGVVGVVALGSREVPRAIAAVVAAMSVAVSLFGALWLWERSHEVATLFDRIVAVQDEALIARNKFFLREAGPVVLDHRWLSAPEPDDLDGPAEVLRRAGVATFSVLQTLGDPEPRIDGATVTRTDRIDALGTTFEVVHLQLRS